jgi:hypothetical protein
LFITGCTKKHYVIYNAVKGKIYSYENKPLSNVKIYVNKFSSNAFDTIITKKDGYFFIDGLELKLSPNYGNFKYNQIHKRVTYTYFIEKTGYKKRIIDIKNFERSNNNKLDTIDLGIIYLEKE